MSADLDNFFARKDRRKQGKKIKEGLKIEVVPDTNDYDNYRNEKGSEFALTETGYTKKEDSDSEWIEENPIEVDFTNLNIQNFDLNELNALIEKKLELDKDPDTLIVENSDNAMPENTDQVENNENTTGWKINESKKKTKEIIEIVEPTPQKKNVFIPPHLRKEMEKKKSKQFVNNEEEFPSLLK